MTKKQSEVIPLYQKEKDPINQMFQRIVYSEGDYVYQEPECIQFLKQSVLKMVDMFAIEDKKTKVGVKREKGGLISAKMDKGQKR